MIAVATATGPPFWFDYFSNDRDAAEATADDLRETVMAPGAASPQAGWGPGGATRPVLDWNNPDDRVGFLDGPHFNSITNTPVYGQEMSFVDARRGSDLARGAFQNEFTSVEGIYVVRAYLENGANDALDPAIGQATGTRIAFRIPGPLFLYRTATSIMSASSTPTGDRR